MRGQRADDEMSAAQPSGAADAGGVGGEPPLLRLAASCPRCGSRPALRVTREAVIAAREQPAEQRVGTYRCQRRGCGTIYDLTARAYHRAS